MPEKPKISSISDLAKYGRFEELQRRISAGESVNLATVFDRAVTDFRTVKRNPGHSKILRWCVDQGLDFESRVGWLNRSILCQAAASGNNDIVEYILQNQPAESPFVLASIGDVDSLKAYASKNDLSDLNDKNGFNLLFNCAESGLGRRDSRIYCRLADACRLLLDRGVDPSHEVEYQLPIGAALLCASVGGNTQIMELLLEHGALAAERFHLVLEHCLEPHQRSGEPYFDIADLIVQRGYDINGLRADQGRSLLHGAANRGAITAVRWLLQHGADPNALDLQGQNPLHACAQRNTSPTVLELLINAGSERSARDSSGNSALDYARENKRTKIVHFLKSIGCQ